MPLLNAPESGVTVRMYRHGLGDCLLLAFATATPNQPYYVLIDCGIMAQSPNEQATMVQLANDLKEATGGHIHLVVASHEHWDHISGFHDAKAVFQSMTLDNLWLAWTENEADPQAQRLRKVWEQDVNSLRLSLERGTGDNALQPVRELFNFFGREDAATTLGAAFSPGTRTAMNELRSFVSKSATSFLEPGGEPKSLPVAAGLSPAGVRAYVMGPPRNEAWLKRLEGVETYEGQPALTAARAFHMAVAKPDDSSPDYEDYEQSLPFPQNLQVSRTAAADDPFFKEHYGFAGASEPWRQIENDWLGVAGELALQMDKLTNNSSLVLAFELPQSKRVLLFSGDAQVGSWLSWGDVTWQIKEGATTKQETAAGLLGRTAFYKVGHHGSHNATVRLRNNQPWGLELMTSPDLVAMLPTNEAAAKQRNWNRMPFKPLPRRLNERTRGRLVRADQDGPAVQPAALSAEEWQHFGQSFVQQKGYDDLTVTDSPPNP